MRTSINSYILLTACAVLAAATGCEREIDMSGDPEVLTVRIADKYVTTRASYSNYVGKFQWDEGDEIIVPYGDDRTKVFSITPGTDPATGTILSSTKGTGLREFYAVFPASAWVDNPSLRIQLPDSYDISSHIANGNVVYAPVPMVAVNDPATPSLDFHHVGGLLRLTCRDVPKDTKKVKVTFDQKVTGTFAVNVDTPAEPYIETAASSTNNSVLFTVTASTGFEEDVPSIVLNIPVPCGTYSSIQVEACKANGELLFSRLHTDPLLSFERAHGKRLMMGDVTVAFATAGNVNDEVDMEYSGGIGEISTDFTSYKKITQDGVETTVPVPFHAEYSPTGAEGSWTTESPDWLTMGAGIDFGGSVEGQRITISVSPSKNSVPMNDNGVPWDTHTDNLKNGPHPVTDLSYYNVAKDEVTQTRSTANCYVVKGPGTYKFPLVYGNAIKNGQPNPDAYIAKDGIDGTPRPKEGTPVIPGSAFLGIFHDHLDRYISSPYIAEHLANQEEGDLNEDGNDNLYINPQAKLLWMDAPGLIRPNTVNLVSEVEQIGEGETMNVDFMTFTITEGDICQGNAVLALLVDDMTTGRQVIAWSWHIWVTDADLKKKNIGGGTNVNDGSGSAAKIVTPGSPTDPDTFKFSTVNLGWIDDRILEEYPDIDYYIRFVQDDPQGDISEIIHIHKKKGPTVSVWGSSPYYQGGRKDPLFLWNGKLDMPEWKTCYPSKAENDYYPRVVIAPGDGTTVGTAIQNPHLFYVGTKSWSSPVIGNGWTSHQIRGILSPFSTSTGPKTIYDPSPVGYKVPYYSSYYVLNPDLSLDSVKASNGINCEDASQRSQFFPMLGYVDSFGALKDTGVLTKYYYSYGGGTYDNKIIMARCDINTENHNMHNADDMNTGAGIGQAFCIRPTMEEAEVDPLLTL